MPKLKDRIIIDTNLWLSFLITKDNSAFDNIFLEDLVTLLYSVTSSIKICRDPKDNFLLALSRDGNASHLLTGDKDLLEIKKFGKTKIQTIREYLNRK